MHNATVRYLVRGFTLIELMIVVAIIGILTAIAIPAYQDYSVRAKMTELVAHLSSYKAAVAEKAWSDNTLSSAGMGLTLTATGRVGGGSVDIGGTITTFGTVAGVGTSVTVALVPSRNADGKVIWACTTHQSSNFKFVPAECRRTA